jgi:myo-inositol-1-phosphate synthase
VTQPTDIAPAKGKLGILLVGLGAVSTTTIAGVMAIRKGLAQPIGSLTQMGTIRLGNAPRVGRRRSTSLRRWQGSTTSCSAGGTSSRKTATPQPGSAGVLENAQLDQIRGELEAVKPMPAVFDQRYVKRLDGPNVKKGKNKRDLAEQLIADIRAFKARHGCDRLVMVWAGSTEVFMKRARCTRPWRPSRRGSTRATTRFPSSMVYAYAALREGSRSSTPLRT